MKYFREECENRDKNNICETFGFICNSTDEERFMCNLILHYERLSDGSPDYINYNLSANEVRYINMFVEKMGYDDDKISVRPKLLQSEPKSQFGFERRLLICPNCKENEFLTTEREVMCDNGEVEYDEMYLCANCREKTYSSRDCSWCGIHYNRIDDRMIITRIINAKLRTLD